MADPWTDAVRQHQVFGLLDEFERNLRAAADSGLTPGGEAGVRRALTAATTVKTRLAQTSAPLVPLTSLNNGAPHLQNANGEISTLLSDRNEGHIANANSYVDALLMEFRWLSQTAFRREAKVFVEAAEQFAGALHERETAVRKSLDALQAEIDVRRAEFADASSSATQRLDGLITSTTASVSSLTAQAESTSKQLRNEVEAQKQRLDAYFEQQQTAHLQAAQQRQTEYNDKLTSFEAEYKRELGRVVSEAEQQQSALSTEGEAALARLRSYEDNAKSIIGVTASAGVTGAYINEASEQKQAADVWRIVACVLLFIVIAGAIVTAIWSPLNGNISNEQIAEYGLTRVPIVVVLGGVFTYAARQSAEHRERERNARRRALELTAFNPFIAQLPETEQRALIGETARKYFRGDDAPLAAERE